MSAQAVCARSSRQGELCVLAQCASALLPTNEPSSFLRHAFCRASGRHAHLVRNTTLFALLDALLHLPVALVAAHSPLKTTARLFLLLVVTAANLRYCVPTCEFNLRSVALSFPSHLSLSASSFQNVQLS